MTDERIGTPSALRRAALALAAAAVFILPASGAISTVQQSAKSKSGPAFRSSFRAPPSEAVKALKAAVGKPFETGWVFVDGRFVPPPYKVERWGNVIRINQIQVTNEIVPWGEFVKTQAGAKVTKTEAPEAESVEEEPEEEEEEEIEEEEVDDKESSLDDLFDDAPAASAKKSSEKKPKRVRRRPKPKKPAAKVTYSFEGEFVPNAKTKAHLKKVDDYRTRIDLHLRSGGYCFFGSRYQPFMGDAGAARHIIDKLPDIMRRNTELESFTAALRSAGIPFMSPSLVDDLFKGRIHYPQIQLRLKKLADPLQLNY